MNSFDLMIERYKRELIDAKRKSIREAIEDAESDDDTSNADDDLIFDEFTEDPLPETAENAAFEEVQNTEPAEQQLEAEILPQEQPLQDKRQSLEQELMAEGRANAQMRADAESDTAFGTIRVQVFAADQVYPISAAHVIITKSGTQEEIFDGYTDTSGIVDGIVVPTPPRYESITPPSVTPYAQYDIFVSHPRFTSRKFINVPVFAEIESIQTVQLVPCESGREDDDMMVVECEPSKLIVNGGESEGEGENG